MRHILLFSSVVFFLDRLIKTLITTTITLNTSIGLIPNFFELTYVENDGAAFSLLSGNRIFLIFMTCVFLGIIYFYFIKGKKLNMMEQVGISLLIGGIFGNLFDRVFLGYVIDYLSFTIFGYQFPIFNLADICIVISVFMIMIKTIKECD